MTNRMMSLLASLATVAALAACSSKSGSLEAAGTATSPSTGDNSGQGTNGGSGGSGTIGTPDTTSSLASVDLKGFVEGGDFDQIQVINFDKDRGELVISMPLGMDSSVPLVSGGTVQSLPGVTFYTNVGADGRTYFVIRVPVRYVLRGVSTLPSSKLPNGDPLPSIPAGELPSVAFSINAASNKKVYLYLGVDAVALYVESSWLSCPASFPICFSAGPFNIKNQAKTKIIAQLTLVMGKTGQSGGFFIASQIPASVAKILDDYFLR